MTHRIRLLLLVALAIPAHLEAQTPRVMVGVPGYEVPVALDTTNRPRAVAGSRAQAYGAIHAAFDKLEIPMTTRDSLRGYMVNPSYVKMRRLQRTSLSTFFNCGSGMTGPNADHFRVTIVIGAFIDSTSEGSRVRVAVAAGAYDVDGASKPPVICGTTGVLEERAVKLASAYLAGESPK